MRTLRFPVLVLEDGKTIVANWSMISITCFTRPEVQHYQRSRINHIKESRRGERSEKKRRARGREGRRRMDRDRWMNSEQSGSDCDRRGLSCYLPPLQPLSLSSPASVQAR